jgi:outer membrane immunogenic protein
MKKLLFLIATTLIATAASAQSAFEGFYGQVGVGYESNSLNSNTVTVSYLDSSVIAPASNFSGSGFSGAIGAGYNYSVMPQFLLGIGVDFNPLSVSTSSGPIINNGTPTLTSFKFSNRLNIFLTPGYEIDEAKLIYLKAGYSMQKVQSNIPVSSDGLVDKNIYIFGEGNYMSYSQINIPNSGTAQAGGVAGSITQTGTPSAYQFLVGVGYKF